MSVWVINSQFKGKRGSKPLSNAKLSKKLRLVWSAVQNISVLEKINILSIILLYTVLLVLYYNTFKLFDSNFTRKIKISFENFKD